MADAISLEDFFGQSDATPPATGSPAPAAPSGAGPISAADFFGAPAAAPSSGGVMATAAEAGRATARGAVKSAGSTLSGGAALADAAARKAGVEAPDLGVGAAGRRIKQFGQETFPPTPGQEDSTTNALAETIGGLAPIVGAGLIGGPAGIGAAMGLGSLQAGDVMEERAAQLREQGQPVDQKAVDTATLASGAIGALIGVIPGADRLLHAFMPATQKAILAYAARTAGSGATGFTIGAMTGALNDAVEKYTMNPAKVIGDGAMSEGALLGAASALLHGAVTEPIMALRNRRARAAAGGTDTPPPGSAGPTPPPPDGGTGPGSPPPDGGAGPGSPPPGPDGLAPRLPGDVRGAGPTPPPPDGGAGPGSPPPGATPSTKLADDFATIGTRAQAEAADIVAGKPPEQAAAENAPGATPAPPAAAPPAREFTAHEPQNATGAEPTPRPATLGPSFERTPEAAAVDAAANEANPSPTQGQKEAGNYKKGHVDFQGLDITIENPKGSTRSGVDAGGKPWSVEMPAHYGYVKGTKGADKDHVDVYVGPDPASQHAFIVDQVDPETRQFDEHKVMLGFPDSDAAMRAYSEAFTDGSGPDRIGGMVPTTVERFKEWLKKADLTAPGGWLRPGDFGPAPAPRADGIAPVKDGATVYRSSWEYGKFDSKYPDGSIYVSTDSKDSSEYGSHVRKFQLNGARLLDLDSKVGRDFIRSDPAHLPDVVRAHEVDENSTPYALFAFPEAALIRSAKAAGYDGLYSRNQRGVGEIRLFDSGKLTWLRSRGAAANNKPPASEPAGGESGAANGVSEAAAEPTPAAPQAPAEQPPLTYGDVFEHKGRRYQINPDDGRGSVSARDLTSKYPLNRNFGTPEAFEKMTGRKFAGAGPEVAPAAPTETPSAPSRKPAEGAKIAPEETDNGATGQVGSDGAGVAGGVPAEPVPRPAEERPAPEVAGNDAGSGGRGSDGSVRADDGGGAGGAGLHGAGGADQPHQEPDGGNSDRPALSDDERAGDRLTTSVKDATPEAKGGDYAITAADAIGRGGIAEKARGNLEAIKLLKAIEREGRPATTEEQAALVKYVGWGAMPQVFEGTRREWQALHAELKGLLTPEEWAAARASTPNAHYTSPDVIDGIYAALARLGYKQGRALEPSAGVGHFLGLMPPEMRAKTRWTAVELDPLTGRIAGLLYPGADLRIMGFEKADMPNGFYDIAVGNVPFGNYPIHDKAYPGSPNIHDYFFLRSLDKVRPGGVVAFVTSMGTMDKPDAAVRRKIAEKAELLGAIRLPGGDKGAFKANAGTEVTTDILFLKRRTPEAEGSRRFLEAAADALGEGHERDTRSENEWTRVDRVLAEPDRDGFQRHIPVNEYFAKHPEMMLGKMALESTMYRANEPMLRSDGRDLGAALREAAGKLPENAYEAAKPKTLAADKVKEYLGVAPGEVKEGGYAVTEKGELARRENGQLVKLDQQGGKKAERIKALIGVRDLARKILHAELTSDEDAAANNFRKGLNKAYDAFVKQHGFLNAKGNRDAFRDDPDAPFVLALENWDSDTKTASKAAIFAKRVIPNRKPPAKADSVNDALLASLNARNGVDLDYMAELTGKTRDDVIAELKGQVFKNPETQSYEANDEYLSGNVREKLRMAESAAKLDPAYGENVEALKSVQPVDLKPSEIGINLGAPWVPTEDVAAFVDRIVGSRGARANYLPSEGLWQLDVQGKQTVANVREWGTDRYNAHELIKDALNQKLPSIYDYMDDGKAVLNQKATIAAREKQQRIKDEFRKWAWADPERAERLLKLYNEGFNSTRQRPYDGAHLTLPGASSAITLNPHQKNAVWRLLQPGNTLLAHTVGAGKTFTMVAGGMEMKRLGLIKKPLYAVPNHMLTSGQFANELLQLYPNARIMVAPSKPGEFVGDKRRVFVSRVATGDWDAVIIGHSAFGKIAMSKEYEQGFIHEQLEQLEDLIRSAKSDGNRSLVKEIEKAKKRRLARLQKLMETAKDQQATFEEMGVDHVFVDEAHLFKNLDTVTKQGNLVGIGSASQRATDLYLKTRYLDQRNPGRGVTFATGTPIANSLAEMHVMQRYLQPRALKKLNLEHFDSWAANFAEAVSAAEMNVAGKFQIKTRLARFNNIPELMALFREVADIQTASMLKLPVPELAGGKATVVTAPKSPEMAALMAHLVERAKDVQQRAVKPEEDNMLKIASHGRHGALDLRAFHDMAARDPYMADSKWLDAFASLDAPDSKLSRVANRIHGIWKDTKSRAYQDANGATEPLKGAAQLAFLDLSAPHRQGFSAYRDIKEKLIARGVPENEIAFIHDFEGDAKGELFKAVRSGKVRVLLGSTDKMGVGTNVQKRLVALHHIDAPWRPADLEQRDGRILRQGNQNKEVEVLRYVTEGSFDGFMWQTLERKANFIDQVMSGKAGVRSIDDVSDRALTFAEMKAIAAGDPRIMEKVEIDNKVQTLTALERAHVDEQTAIARDLRTEIGRLPDNRDAALTQAAVTAKLVDMAGDNFKVTIGGKEYKSRPDAAKALAPLIADTANRAVKASGEPLRPVEIGSFAGQPLSISGIKRKLPPEPELYLWLGPEGPARVGYGVEPKAEASQVQAALTLLPRKMRERAATGARIVAEGEKKIADLKAQQGKPFARAAELEKLIERQKQLEKDLGVHDHDQQLMGADQTATADEQPGQGEEDDSGDKAYALRQGAASTSPLPTDAEAQLRASLDRVGLGDIGVRLVDKLSRSTDAIYWRGVITVARDAPGGLEAMKALVAGHEAVHAMRDLGLFTQGEWKAVESWADKFGRRRYGIDERYGEGAEMRREEAFAHLARDVAAGATHPGGLIGRAIRNISNFLEAVGNWARGNGFQSAEGIAGKIQSGEIGARPRQGAPAAEPQAALRDTVDRTREAGRGVFQRMKDFASSIMGDLQHLGTPMAGGSQESRATVKDFANAERVADQNWQRVDEALRKNFDVRERAEAGRVLDEASVAAQRGEPVAPILARLSPGMRRAVETLESYGQELWDRATQVGLVRGEKIPYYMTRMAVLIGEDGSVGRIPGKSGYGATSKGEGGNIYRTTPQLQRRNFLESEDTEAALRAKFGQGASLVRDIRALPLALARFEKAIAGRELINQIRDMGTRAGVELVRDGAGPGFFTLDHPAFTRYQPRLRRREEEGPRGGTWEAVKDDQGKTVFDKAPIYVRKDFEGPLRSVMTQPSGATYAALMGVKGRAMSAIMYSPLIHNAVEWGRAFPLLPGKVLTFKIYFEGNKAKHDPAQMREAVENGMSPIGHRAFNQDITSIAEQATATPGRGLTAKGLGLLARPFGEGAEMATRRAVDAAGDFWHNTLLWDRVGDLQMGIYTNIRDANLRQGMDARTAGREAAHFANRFAGALPREAMSAGATKLANLTLFSRTFTLGNLGVIKDAVMGLPRDVQAQILRDGGELAHAAAQSSTRKRAIHSLVMDLGLLYVGNALLQTAFDKWKEDKSWDQVGQGYVNRFHALIHTYQQNPLEILNPLMAMEMLSPTYENEETRRHRIRVGHDSRGTAIYARNPVGKVTEDFVDWLTSPLETLKKKLSTFVRPALNVISNDQGFGRHVYDPYDKSVGGMAKAAGNVVWHFMQAQLPVGAIEGASDIALQPGDHAVDTLKAVGPLAGVTFSSGAAGGEARGDAFRARDRYEAAIKDSAPRVNKLIDRGIASGNFDDAVQAMTDLRMSAGEIRARIQYRVNPAASLQPNKRLGHDVRQHATPEERQSILGRFSTTTGG